jgi:hypothetical protein
MKRFANSKSISSDAFFGDEAGPVGNSGAGYAGGHNFSPNSGRMRDKVMSAATNVLERLQDRFG